MLLDANGVPLGFGRDPSSCSYPGCTAPYFNTKGNQYNTVGLLPSFLGEKIFGLKSLGSNHILLETYNLAVYCFHLFVF